MRTLILGLLLGWSCFAAPALVQQKTATDVNNGVVTATFSVALTAGNSVIACISDDATGSPIVSVRVGSESLTLAAEVAPGFNPESHMYYIHNITGGEVSLVVSMIDVGRVSVNASEWSGLTNAAPVTNTNSNAGSSTVTTGSVTPATANNLVLGIGAWVLNDYSSGPTNGFTRMTQIGNATTSQESAYLIQASATAASTGWSLTAGIKWTAVIVAFGAPVSGPTNAQRSAGFWVVP